MQFIIATNSASGTNLAATASERDAITGFLEGKGWHVWHWFQDLWLINSGTEYVSKNALLEELLSVLNTKREIMLFTKEENEGYSINARPAALPWLRAHWGNSVKQSAPGNDLTQTTPPR